MKDEKILGAQSATEDVSAGSIASDAATARHTPGPWTVFIDGPHVSILATAHPYPTIALVTGGLDDVYEQGLMGPTSHANAHLIAAAPELYEALKRLFVHLENDATDSFCEWCYAHAPKDDAGRVTGAVTHRLDCEYRITRSAIAKAEGRS